MWRERKKKKGRSNTLSSQELKMVWIGKALIQIVVFVFSERKLATDLSKDVFTYFFSEKRVSFTRIW